MTKYLPPLGLLIPINKLPDSLGSIKTGIIDVFNNLYYSDLYTSKSFHSNTTVYSLNIATNKKLSIPIEGSNGLELVLNPGYTSVDNSEFLVSFSFQWNIPNYIKDPDLGSYGFPRSYHNTHLHSGMRALNIKKEEKSK